MATPPSKKPRLGRTLALPFVVTAASACTVKSAPASETTPATTPAAQPDSNGASSPREAHGHHQTEPVSGSAPAAPSEGGDQPGVIVNPPRLPKAPESGGSVQKRDDGTCWFYYEANCPPDATCNPPPPQQVQCPAESDGEQS